MVVIERCCCCSVRTASLIFAGLALFGSFVQLSNCGREIANYLTTNVHQKNEQIDILYEELHQFGVERSDIGTFQKISFYMAFPDLILCLAIIGAAYALLHGVRKKKPAFLIPVMVLFGLDFIVRLVFLMVLITCFGFTNPISMVASVIFFYGVIVDILVGLCIFSHWQQLKEEDDHQTSYGEVSKA